MSVLTDDEYAGPLSTDGTEKVIDSFPRERNRSEELAVTTDRSIEGAFEEVSMGDRSSIDAAKGSPDLSFQVAQLQTNQTDTEESLRILSEQALKIAEVTGTQDYYMSGSLTYDDPAFSPATARALVNLQLGAEIIEDARRAAEEDKSWAGYTADFIDRSIFRQLPIGLWEDIMGRTGRKSTELLDAASSMSPDQYKEFIGSYIEELKAEGVFRDDNWFALGQGSKELELRGVDPERQINAVLGVAEVLTIVPTVRIIKKLANLKGPDKASEAFEAVSRKGAVDGEVLAEASPSIVDPMKGSVKPNAASVDKFLEENELLKGIETYTKVGSFGRRATDAELSGLAKEAKAALSVRLSRPIADAEIESRGLGEVNALFKIGKVSDGKPFSTFLNAQKQVNHLQKNGLAASYAPVDPNDLTKGYYVEVRHALDQTNVGKDLEFNKPLDFVRRNLAKVFGSTRQSDDPFHNTLATMTESAKGLLVRETKPYIRSLEKLSVKDQGTLDEITSELRDGADSFKRQWYTDAEFNEKWRALRGEYPTAAQREAYGSVITLSDTAYMLKANELVRHYVSNGYMVIENGKDFFMAKAVKEFESADKVLDMKTGNTMRASDVPEGVTIWRTTTAVNKNNLVINPKNVRNPEYRHVLNYNAGGSRIQADANFYVVAGTRGGRGRAILSSFSEKQAKIAELELNNIRKALLQDGRPIATLTDELDQVISSNNTWNPSIENTQDLIAFAKKKNLDLTEGISYRGKDQKVESANDLWDSTSYQFYTQANMRRSDDSLTEFGGADTFSHSPVKSVVTQLSDAFNEYAFKNYSESAKVSFLKRFNNGKVPVGNTDTMFSDAMETLRAKPITKQWERELLEFGNVIQRRTHFKSPAVRAFERFGQELQEFVFGISGKKVNIGDPTNVLLRLGFQSAFGFGNISQFIMQGSQVGAILSISPLHGMKAAGLMPALRLVMAADSKEGVKRLAKTFGMKPNEIDEIIAYVRTSGRDLVESDAIEKNIGPGLGISGFGGQSYIPSVMREGLYRSGKLASKGLAVGLTPFREGEKLSRYTSMLTAILEYKAKNPNASILSDSARAFINNRDQLLTFDMTTGSRAAFQTGLMRVPTQWLGYSFRALEQVTMGRDLTKFERARLSLFLAMQGGLAGFGMSSSIDSVSEWLGIEPDSVGFVGLKYGMFDAILSYGLTGLTGTEVKTAMGSRLAPLSTFFDLYRRITEDATYEALGGPSTSILFGASSNLLNAIGDIYHGRYASSLMDIEKVARTASGIDNIAKASGILQYQTYRSKTGSSLDFEFDDIDAYLAGLGISNFKVIEYYNRRGEVWRDTKSLRNMSKKLQKDFREALVIAEQDPEAGAQLIREAEAKIVSSGFSPAQQMELRRALSADTTLDSVELIIDLLKKNNEYGAEVVQSFTKGNN